MANTISSPNMGLPIPVTGQDPGPDYANNINASLTSIDQHNHTAGQGVQIPAAGLNINTDLSFNNNNAVTLRSTRYAIQPALLSLATDLGCLYVSGLDLYYNDVNGNQIRITQSGGVAGSPGSIANLTSPASASYVSANSTFVWQSGANTAANMDGGSVLLRNLSANSKALTLNPPAAMAANYSLTLPSIPGAAAVLALDTAGNIATGIASTVQTNDLADGSVTGSKLAALNIATSASSGNASGTSTSFANVANLSVTLVTSGRPVFVGLIADGSNSNSTVLSTGTGGLTSIFYAFQRDGSTRISHALITSSDTGGNSVEYGLPPSAMSTIDFPTAGSHSYTFQAAVSSGSWNVAFVKLVAYEL